MSLPLRYQISDWHQLTQCLSNNSGMLHICVSDILNESSLNCTLIQVKHDTYGILFAYCVDESGELLSGESLSTDMILKELNRFGFDIIFAKKMNLKPDQLEYLTSLKGLQYDKIRQVNTLYTIEAERNIVVAFNSSKLGNWLSNTYNPSYQELSEALYNCSACIIPEYEYDWSWLTYIGNIDEILKDNSRINK